MAVAVVLVFLCACAFGAVRDEWSVVYYRSNVYFADNTNDSVQARLTNGVQFTQTNRWAFNATTGAAPPLVLYSDSSDAALGITNGSDGIWVTPSDIRGWGDMISFEEDLILFDDGSVQLSASATNTLIVKTNLQVVGNAKIGSLTIGVNSPVSDVVSATMATGIAQAVASSYMPLSGSTNIDGIAVFSDGHGSVSFDEDMISGFGVAASGLLTLDGNPAITTTGGVAYLYCGTNALFKNASGASYFLNDISAPGDLLFKVGGGGELDMNDGDIDTVNDLMVNTIQGQTPDSSVEFIKLGGVTMRTGIVAIVINGITNIANTNGVVTYTIPSDTNGLSSGNLWNSNGIIRAYE